LIRQETKAGYSLEKESKIKILVSDEPVDYDSEIYTKSTTNSIIKIEFIECLLIII